MGNIKIIGGSFDTKLELEHAGVAAGFPSPADEYRHETLDFNRDYIRHPEASFYGDVEGDSMRDAGLLDGDRVIIDRAVEPHDGSIVVAWWDGGFTMKFLDQHTRGRFFRYHSTITKEPSLCYEIYITRSARASLVRDRVSRQSR